MRHERSKSTNHRPFKALPKQLAVADHQITTHRHARSAGRRPGSGSRDSWQTNANGVGFEPGPARFVFFPSSAYDRNARKKLTANARNDTERRPLERPHFACLSSRSVLPPCAHARARAHARALAPSIWLPACLYNRQTLLKQDGTDEQNALIVR